MKLRVLHIDLALADCSTRFPFRYGVATLREAPLLTARVTIEAQGVRAVGHSADLLVPKWFEKDPSKSLDQDALALTASARAAAEAWRAPDGEAASLFDHWWRAYQRCVSVVPLESPDRLVRGFGVALIERAVMDATCKAAGSTFHQALRGDLFGLEPGRVYPELEGWDLAQSLTSEPLTSVQVRHTVGLLDPLTRAEIPPELAVDDGLPVALEDDIAFYGLEVFKVKVTGSDDAARERLLAVAAVARAGAGDPARFTLDGNEQVEDLGEFLAMLEGLRATDDGAWFLERLLWIEQPLHRTVSFDEERCAPMDALSEVAPVILDEADSGTEAFPLAVARGYRGISSKNCKGVIRSLLHRGLTERLGEGLFQTGEDLTNLGVLAVQQDLATVASLGLGHVERNGHHYFRGLDHLHPSERVEALQAHPCLYRSEGDLILLDVRDGALDLSDVVNAVGYGHRTNPDFELRTPVEAWEQGVLA